MSSRHRKLDLEKLARVMARDTGLQPAPRAARLQSRSPFRVAVEDIERVMEETRVDRYGDPNVDVVAWYRKEAGQ